LRDTGCPPRRSRCHRRHGSTENLLGESETGVSHGQGGGTSTILGLDNLVTAKLDAVHEGIVLVVGDRDRRRGLAEERNNGLTRVTTNDGDGQLLGVSPASDLGNEGLGTDDVEGGDTKETLGVEDALGLEDLGRDGDGRVDGVGDDENEGVRGNLGSDLNQALHNASIDVEKVVTSHTRLAGDTSGDDNNVSVLERLLSAIIGREVASGLGAGGDVGEIGGNAGGVDNIVESKLVDVGREREEERERLANATRSARDNSLDHLDGVVYVCGRG